MHGRAAIGYAVMYERQRDERRFAHSDPGGQASPDRRRADAGQDRRAARQSRNARHRRCRRRAPLSQGVPDRSAGDRGSGAALGHGPQRHHPAGAAVAEGARLPQDLELREERIAAQDHHALPVRETGEHARAARPPYRRRLGDALRQSVDGVEDRSPGVAGLRAHSGASALSAVLRGDHRDGLRRGLPRADDAAPSADGADCCAVLQRQGLHRVAGVLDAGRALAAAVQARGRAGLVSRRPEGVRRQGRSVLRCSAWRPCGCCATCSSTTTRS